MGTQVIRALLLAGAALAAAASASAATYNFAITGPQTVTFQLDSSPLPTVIDPGNYFVLRDVSGTIDNINTIFDLGFGSPSYFFNFGLLNNTVGTGFVSTGPTLFTGTESNPTFNLGTFSLASNTGPVYSLTISEVGGAVPEPASWAMMIAGFGLIGVTARRQRRTATAA